MPYPMIEMVVIDGKRYKPADAARLGHKAIDANMPIGVEPRETDEVETDEVETDEVETTQTVEQPSRGGSKEAWIEFAKSVGASDEDIEGKSRDDLADAYGA